MVSSRKKKMALSWGTLLESALVKTVTPDLGGGGGGGVGKGCRWKRQVLASIYIYIYTLCFTFKKMYQKKMFTTRKGCVTQELVFSDELFGCATRDPQPFLVVQRGCASLVLTWLCTQPLRTT